LMSDRILVPVDGSPTSDAHLEEAIRLASLTRVRMLLHAVTLQPYRCWRGRPLSPRVSTTRCARAARRFSRAPSSPLKWRVSLRKPGWSTPVQGASATSSSIHPRKWQADLIVIGTHGRRGVRRLLLALAAHGRDELGISDT